MQVHDLFEFQTRNSPFAVALIQGTRVWTYRDAKHWSDALLDRMVDQGVARGHHVGVMLGNTAVHLMAVLALSRIGAVAISLSPSKANASGLKALCHLDLKHLLLPAGAKAHEGVNAIQIQTEDAQWAPSASSGAPNAVSTDSSTLRQEAPSSAVQVQVSKPDEHSTFKIALSSGATGQQKAVPWTHQQFLMQFHLQRNVRAFGSGVRLLPLLGFEATVGVDACIRQLCAGGTVVTLPSPTLERLCATIDAHAVTHILSTPGIISKYIRMLPAGQQRFPQLEGLRLTGGAVTTALRERLASTVCDNISVDYGASEVGTIAVGTRVTYRKSDRCAGHIAPWIEAEAVDDAGQPLAAGMPGRLRFRHQHLPTNYVDGTPTLQEGWFYPGDEGIVDTDSLLFIESRSDDLMNIGGVKVRPAEIEAQVLAIGGVTDACAYAVPTASGVNAIIVAVEAPPEFNEAGIMPALRERLGRKCPAKVIRVAQLPRNEMGKVLRRRLIAATKVS